MPKQISILLADDDKDDRFFFNKALQEIPLSTHLATVEDGERLMKFLKENERELPDVIFLDINMPKKNGIECLAEIKRDKKLDHIPIVMYSTSLQEEVANSLYEQGAHYYLQKPNFTELPDAINKILTTLKENPQQPPQNKFLVHVPAD